jgi:hypothetical protein
MLSFFRSSLSEGNGEVTKEAFRRDNHYVPRMYLKQWATDNQRLWVYRILVSHDGVPHWKAEAPRAVAYQSHLYTRYASGAESDEIEKWLHREFEAPAVEPFRKATSDLRMSGQDWRKLARFVVVQDLRTPARFLDMKRRLEATLPGIMDQALRDVISSLEKSLRDGSSLPDLKVEPADGGPPMRVIQKHEPNQPFGEIGVEMVIGRDLWLHEMKRLLTKVATKATEHKWTILHPPKDLTWFTSDDPVVRLNFTSLTQYDFDGGWGSPGTEIIMPLSPNHLLYTQIGKSPPRRGTRMPVPLAELTRRLIARHAHRSIFSSEKNPEVPILRPRVVDASMFDDERQQWMRWHDEQSLRMSRALWNLSEQDDVQRKDGRHGTKTRQQWIERKQNWHQGCMD